MNGGSTDGSGSRPTFSAAGGQPVMDSQNHHRLVSLSGTWRSLDKIKDKAVQNCSFISATFISRSVIISKILWKAIVYNLLSPIKFSRPLPTVG